MCTNLNDLFACLRPQVIIDSDDSQYQGNEDVVPGPPNGSRRNALKLKQLKKEKQQQQPSKDVPLSATISVLRPSRPQKIPRPSTQDSRISYEAMERYDQIFGGPDGPDSSLRRDIPHQF